MAGGLIFLELLISMLTWDVAGYIPIFETSFDIIYFSPFSAGAAVLAYTLSGRVQIYVEYFSYYRERISRPLHHILLKYVDILITASTID